MDVIWSDPVVLTFSLIIVWSAGDLFVRIKRLNFAAIFHLFVFFFFGIAPMYQYLEGMSIAPIYDNTLFDDDFLRANLVILAILFIFDLIYFLESRRLKLPSVFVERKVRSGWILGGILFISVLAFVWYQGFDWQNIFFRGGSESVARLENSQLQGLVFRNFVRYVPVAVAFSLMACFRLRIWQKCILMIPVFICCAPTGMARLQVVPVYMPFLMLFVPCLKYRKNTIVLMLVAGILFVFPFMHQFREAGADIDWLSFGTLDFSFFNALHFDSYASLAYVLKQKFIPGSQQLLGAALFWVPRSVWPGKPDHSGRLLNEVFGLGLADDFEEVAVNFFAEGYMGLGLFGVFAFAVVIAWFCAFADRAFWGEKRNFHSPAIGYYFSGLGMLFFLLRGALMVGVSLASGMLLSYFITENIIMKRDHRREESV